MESDESLLEAWPGIRLDADNADYFRGLLEHKLLIQRCRDCRRWHHPPRSVCPRCWSRDVAAEPVSGRGTIALLTVLRQGPPFPGVDYAAGHPIIAVELEEQKGLRVAGSVVDAQLEQLQVGAAVELCFRDVAGRPPTPEFRLLP